MKVNYEDAAFVMRKMVGTNASVLVSLRDEGGTITAPYAKDPKGMMDFLRTETYKLSPKPLDCRLYGKDF